MITDFHSLAQDIIRGCELTRAEAADLYAADRMPDIFVLLCAANTVRAHFKGDTVDLCGIINAKSGLCSENCIFCAQSAHHNTGVEEYPLLSPEQMRDKAFDIAAVRACRMGIVTSGNKVTDAELDRICEGLRAIKKTVSIGRCASLGCLSEKALAKLKDAGLERYHHNLETSERFFPVMCTTHTYADRVRTVRAAQAVGLSVCSGALFGLGENADDRIDVAFALKDLNVDCVPLNFLNPIKGTPLEHTAPMEPLTVLKTIALFRLVMPRAGIRVCGGREVTLRGLQPLMFVAGANGTMIGNYLTTAGRDFKQDLQDIADLALKPMIREELSAESFM